MKTREQVIESIKDLCKKHEEIVLSLGEIGVASWEAKGKKLDNETWKHIGYVSAMSWAFDITPEEL